MITEPHRTVADAGGTSDTVDVRDMLVVHTALLREFRLAPAAVHRVADGERRQASTVGTHLRCVCDLLHHHHEGEYALLWPLIRERVPDASRRVVDDAEAQHDAIDRALTDVRALTAAWTADPQEPHRTALAGALDHLHTLLREHLDLEERALLPLAAATLTQAEWDAVGEAAVASMGKPALVLAFGMFAYEGDPAVLRGMLAPAPPPVRALLPRLAPRVYARRARRVYGTARP